VLLPAAAAAAAREADGRTTSAAAGGRSGRPGPAESGLDSFIVDEEEVASRRRAARAAQAAAQAAAALLAPKVRAQPPVASGATPGGEGRPRFLAYDLLGAVVSRPVGDHASIEVTFHDTAKHRRRIPLFADYYGLSLAALGERGVLYAAPAAGAPGAAAGTPAMLVYRPFDAWAANAEWSVALPAGEEAACVAVGDGFAAAATSARLLRLFTPSGLQSFLLTLPGAPVALAAAGGALAAVWHAGPPHAEGEAQNLAFAVYDVPSQSRVAAGPLLLSERSTLTWLGFTADGLLAAADSAGVLRVCAARACAAARRDAFFCPAAAGRPPHDRPVSSSPSTVTPS
jgi:chromosome transmission fidelity protein 4